MNRESRQALVELLFLALYLDNHLSLLEEEALEKALGKLGWAPAERNELDVAAAFALVRAVRSDEEKSEAFLQERVAVLKADGHAGTAFEWLGRVLASDGLDAAENRFLDRARKLLFDS